MSDICTNNGIMKEFTYDDAILILQNVNPSKYKDVWGRMKKELREFVLDGLEDMMYSLDEHKEDIMTEAFPKDQKLRRDSNFNEETCEQIARDVYNFLMKHELWQDVCIYYNGKRMSTSDGKKFRYNGEPFIEEGKNPRDYFEYVNNPHILSMSFEGLLYEYLNGYDGYGTKIEDEFQNLFKKYGLYYELGNAWNLTCFPI